MRITPGQKRRPAAAPKYKRNVFFGDNHTGSHYGVWPAHDLPRGAKWIGARYLWDCYRHAVDQIEECNILFLSGDLIDGSQRKSDGTGVFGTSLLEQTEAAIEVIRPLAERAERIIRVEGTPYHEGFHGALALLDSELGVGLASQVVDLDMGTGVLNFAHHPGGGSALYLGTKLNREAMFAALAAARGDTALPRWVVRGHLHEWGYWDGADGIACVQLPCFKLQDPHAKKTHYWKFQPVLGLMEMVADERAASGYQFIPRVYQAPTPRVIDPGSIPLAKTRRSPSAA